MMDGLFGVAVTLSLTAVTYGAAPPPRIDAVLRDWASATERVVSAEYRFTLTMHDKAFGDKTPSEGKVRFCKPGYLRMDLTQGKASTSCVFIPESIHLFDPARRTESVMPWPKDRSFLGATEPGRRWWQFGLAIRDGFAQDLFWRLLGPPPLEVAKHFRLRLAKEDASYIYLEGNSRSERSKENYRSLQVVLTETVARKVGVRRRPVAGSPGKRPAGRPPTAIDNSARCFRLGTVLAPWNRIAFTSRHPHFPCYSLC